MALIFSKDFRKKAKNYGGIEVMYDSSSGGADFVLRLGKDKKIIVEVGFGKKNDGIKQIKSTGKIIGGYDYGIVLSHQGNLELLSDKIIRIPFKFWLMI